MKCQEKIARPSRTSFGRGTVARLTTSRLRAYEAVALGNHGRSPKENGRGSSKKSGFRNLDVRRSKGFLDCLLHDGRRAMLGWIRTCMKWRLFRKSGVSASCDGSARTLRVAVSRARFSPAERMRDASLTAKVGSGTAGLKPGSPEAGGEELGTIESGLQLCCLKRESCRRARTCRPYLLPPSFSLKSFPERVAARFRPKAIMSDP